MEAPAELPTEYGTQEAAETYRRRLERTRRQMSSQRRLDRTFVRARTGLFLALLVTGAWLIGDRRAVFPFAVTGCLLAATMIAHRPLMRRLRRSERLQRWYSSCLQRLTRHWRELPADGAPFLSADHPWSGDLDLFGPGSLFQKICECRTLPAQRLLASWMTEVPSADQVRRRQAMAESLRQELDLRERLSLTEEAQDWGAAEATLHGWADEQARPIPLWIVAAAAVLGVVGAAVLLLAASGVVPFSVVVLVFLLQIPLMLLARDQIRGVMAAVDHVDQALRQLSGILTELESHRFSHPDVRALQQTLIVRDTRASVSIRSLSSRIAWLNNSVRNQFLIPFAWLFGMVVLLTDRIERWRVKYASLIPGWIAATAEIEVLLTVAAWSFDHGDGTLPELSDGEAEFRAEGLGHPLIPRQECVANDVELSRQKPLILISGSNMSGKSTLLRSVGTSLVLTWCGARVNARRLITTPFQIATVMRVSDSLMEGRSLFYSVVRRLRQVVDLTEGEYPVLFLLDEILNGTNSTDRRRGAEAVIRSLLKRGAMGLVTTHDLELTRIVDSLDGQGVNCHFEDQITDGRMTFDYRLREGVVERSNAIELMRMMGLDV